MLPNIICNKYIKPGLSLILLMFVYSCQNKQGSAVDMELLNKALENLVLVINKAKN